MGKPSYVSCPRGAQAEISCARVALALSLGLGAQAEPPAVSSPPSSPPHNVSTKVLEAVAAKLPKYLTPAPVKRPDFAEPQEGVYTANGTFQLPNVTIHPSTPLPATEFTFLSAKGRMALAMKHAPGLHIGNIFHLNEGFAMAILTEEREVRKKADLSELVESVAVGSTEEEKGTRQMLKAAVQRP